MALESPQIQKSNGAGRKIRLHSSVVTQSEMHQYVLNLIKNDNITGTKAIGQRIGKKERQTKRILDQMAFSGLIEQDPNTGRLVKTQKQEKIEFDERLFDDKFNTIPEIKKFIEKNQRVKPKTLQGYLSALKQIFKNTKTNPASVLVSKTSSEEFFKNYEILCKTLYPKKQDAPQNQRVAYRQFIADVGGFVYPHGGAREYGFGSHHASFQKYAGCHIPLDVCNDLQEMMLEDKEFLVYTWFCTGIMTGARTGGMASMTWDKVNLFLEDFRLDQFETKDNRSGHLHLGQFGEWKHKFPPKELYHILLKWKNDNPQFSKFLWFEDGGSDKKNLIQVKKIAVYVIPKLKKYLHRVEDRLDTLTKEYCFEAGEAGHLNRHTFAQLMRNAGASKSEIAFAGGWKSEQTIDWYTSISEDEKSKSRKVLAEIFSK